MLTVNTSPVMNWSPVHNTLCLRRIDALTPVDPAEDQQPAAGRMVLFLKHQVLISVLTHFNSASPCLSIPTSELRPPAEMLKV